jgi:hypothetical protein
MQNRKTLNTKDGFSLVEVTETDENGKVTITGYEVYGPNGDLLESFSNLKDAQNYLGTVLPDSEPEPPGSSSGLSM